MPLATSVRRSFLKMSSNKKKKKTVYIDDGRTIADMSGLYGRKASLSTEQPRIRGQRGTAKERWQTYVAAVKMMFLPMMATIGAICVVFLLLYLAFTLALL